MSSFFEIKIISATYLVNMDYLTNQDPYVWCCFNGKEYYTSVKNYAGLQATWNETFKLEYNDEESSELVLFSYDKDVLGSDLIGKTNVIELHKYPEGNTVEIFK